eukprot:scaffold82447_cov63-Phaeocystis_antarctica.AAC.2
MQKENSKRCCPLNLVFNRWSPENRSDQDQYEHGVRVSCVSDRFVALVDDFIHGPIGRRGSTQGPPPPWLQRRPERGVKPPADRSSRHLTFCANLRERLGAQADPAAADLEQEQAGGAGQRVAEEQAVEHHVLRRARVEAVPQPAQSRSLGRRRRCCEE